MVKSREVPDIHALTRNASLGIDSYTNLAARTQWLLSTTSHNHLSTVNCSSYGVTRASVVRLDMMSCRQRVHLAHIFSGFLLSRAWPSRLSHQSLVNIVFWGEEENHFTKSLRSWTIAIEAEAITPRLSIKTDRERGNPIYSRGQMILLVGNPFRRAEPWADGVCFCSFNHSLLNRGSVLG
jgi:hypothetical protein